MSQITDEFWFEVVQRVRREDVIGWQEVAQLALTYEHRSGVCDDCVDPATMMMTCVTELGVDGGIDEEQGGALFRAILDAARHRPPPEIDQA